VKSFGSRVSQTRLSYLAKLLRFSDTWLHSDVPWYSITDYCTGMGKHMMFSENNTNSNLKLKSCCSLITARKEISAYI